MPRLLRLTKNTSNPLGTPTPPSDDSTPVADAGGFIALYRSLLDHPALNDADALALWVRLLLMANHKPGRVRLQDGATVTVPRGGLLTGRRVLASSSGITERKVRTLLDRFEREGMISRNAEHRRCSVIEITAYDKWQFSYAQGDENRPRVVPGGAPQEGPQNVPAPAQRPRGFEPDSVPATVPATVPRSGADAATNNNTTTFLEPNGSCPSPVANGPDQGQLIDSGEQAPKKPAPPLCPHQQIIDLYHEVLPQLPRVVKARWAGSVRARDLTSRWKESKAHQDLDFWRQYFTLVARVPFYMGHNDRGWKADLGWLVKRANFDKMIDRIANDLARRGR